MCMKPPLRATANKYLRTPHGLFPFKFFFTPGYSGKHGDAVSNTSVKEIIGSIIEQEDSKKPLSDRAIVDILAGGILNLPAEGRKIPGRIGHRPN